MALPVGLLLPLSRFAPRAGLLAAAAVDLWLKDIGPSLALRRWFNRDPSRWAEFTRRYAEVIAHHSGRDVEQVTRDIDRDRFLSPEEAVAYGLADSVLAARNGDAAAA